VLEIVFSWTASDS